MPVTVTGECTSAVLAILGICQGLQSAVADVALMARQPAETF